MERLVVCVMGQNCEKFVGMCLDSVDDADFRIYCDGGSKDNTLDIVGNKIGKTSIISNEYDQEDREMNGKQRNFYLKYLKEHYPKDWCLCLDADEVVEDISKIKEFIQLANPGVYSINMRHFIGDLGHEDATVQEHFVLNRLFKISEAESYPEVEHPVLKGNLIGVVRPTTIWHLAYIPNLWEIKKRYENHLKKSNMHTPEYLANWYRAHLFGQYPKSQIKAEEIPKIILKEFLIDPDEIYFNTHSTIETRHFMMMGQWVNLFKPKNIVELGCGIGLYGFVSNYLGIPYEGLELSQFAVDHAVTQGIKQGNITKKQDYKDKDLVLVLDVLEHLCEKDLDKTLKQIKKYGKKYLFSIPFIGDPNLELDKTHRIKKSKEWWKVKLSKYFKIESVPESWLFKHQLLIGVPK